MIAAPSSGVMATRQSSGAPSRFIGDHTRYPTSPQGGSRKRRPGQQVGPTARTRSGRRPCEPQAVNPERLTGGPREPEGPLGTPTGQGGQMCSRGGHSPRQNQTYESEALAIVAKTGPPNCWTIRGGKGGSVAT